MFCDIVGSTALSSRLDPEDLRELLAAYHACATEIIDQHHGYIAQYLGDGVLVYFGYPQAQEDDAERAVRAGLALIEALSRIRIAGEMLRIRIGIATGLSVVGDLFGSGAMQERGAIGETPNLAARLQGLAEPGTIVIGLSTRKLLGELFLLRDLGSVAVKGIDAPVCAWQVLGEAEVTSRFDALRPGRTRLVGRRSELKLLLRSWREASQGRGRVVLVSGEAGIGKSRLISTLCERVSPALRFFCSPSTVSTALHPVIRELERLADFHPIDSAETRWSKLATFVAPHAVSPDDLTVLGEALALPRRDANPPARALSAQERKDRLFSFLMRLFQRLLGTRGSLIVWEDLHWIDPTSREVLDRLVEGVKDLPVMMLATFRPDFNPEWQQGHVVSIALTRLTPQQNTSLAIQVAGHKGLPLELLEQIIDRTDGIPLFTEEFTKAILEAEVLHDVGDRYELKDALPAMAVPSTLEASLLARLDRLGPARDVAHISAVIGREFSYDVLARVAKVQTAQLRQGLGHLVEAGLIHEQMGPTGSYMFKHALVQEAAYHSILKKRRRVIHASVADVLEQHFPAIAETQPEVLAHHHRKAGNNRPALEYLITAARRSLNRSATIEAERHARQGLELLAETPEVDSEGRFEVALHLARGRSLIILKGEHAEQTGRAFRSAHERCSPGADPDVLFQVLDGLCAHYFSRRELELTVSTSHKLLDLGRRSESRRITITGLRALGSASFLMGSFQTARQAFESILSLYDPVGDGGLALQTRTDPKITSLAFLSLVDVIEGNHETALHHRSASIEAAEAIGHPPSLTFAFRLAAFLDALVEDWGALLSTADVIVAISQKHHFPVWGIEGQFFRSLALLELHREAEALSSMERALDELSAGQTVWPFFHGALAWAQGTMGNLSRAEELLAQAREVAVARGERWYCSELLRKHAEVRKRGSEDRGEAEHLLKEALHLSQVQGAALWQVRSSIDLARLWREQGRIQEAEALLWTVNVLSAEKCGDRIQVPLGELSRAALSLH
jgi:class 3 adenylate cyclase/tetratricopeptide (TPR) repeat protein